MTKTLDKIKEARAREITDEPESNAHKIQVQRRRERDAMEKADRTKGDFGDNNQDGTPKTGY